ncbi:hypothetical protein M404DRAFT_30891 [Pisolithus tinctorius Marx 270]|uniref:Integrase catalytic domain-containing protein n=1 Tax=Pisolithus tinctorius Marx 270 TaxID=870435 RepID=A0A0C3NUN8_PISTI|nr:hypothetical protein M404DRAFT_30891 [Pisolithus tinctorius Marx 270]
MHETAFAWDATERGTFQEDMFPLLKIPTLAHKPWVKQNIPIPPAIFRDVVSIIKEKMSAGVYKPSTSSYCSKWFCIVRKDGKSLCLVHDLQDSAVPPFVDSIAEAFACHSVYGILDLMVRYDHRTIHDEYCDLTTFQTPISTLRLTKLPMGYMNAVQIFHRDICWILKDEILEVTIPFIDDCPIKGPKSRYQNSDGTYQTIAQNSRIRCFICEHLQNVNHILHHLCHAGATISAKKCVIAVPSIIVLGHKVSFEGRILDKAKVQKIKDWPYCTNVTEVRGFLGLCLYCRIFIKDFAKPTCPLVKLTKKDVSFEFRDEHREAMDQAIVSSPALRTIDYNSERKVILAVDTSNIAVGYLLMQEGEDGKCYPARFGSITLNNHECCYSQAKLVLFGLFRTLHDGMINNPDLQPNATINCWIAGILLFDFELVHVPAHKHAVPDGLSRRPKAEEDEDGEEDYEEWIDECGAFTVELSNCREAHFESQPYPSEIPSTLSDSPSVLSQSLGIYSSEQTSPSVYEMEIPCSEKAIQREERLKVVKEFLETKKKPEGLEEVELASLVHLATWILRQAHDELGHKGIYSTCMQLLTHFWWPMLEQDVCWYVKSCHKCQICHLDRVHIPPVVAIPEPLFFKAYMDKFLMPKSNGFRYVTQACCSLTSYPEWAMLCTETGKTIGKFIFEQILCHWGAVAEIVTDNGGPYVLALDWLSKTFRICHI